tara:strand:- start:203 stop:484 length:282 start_codon:yes stop_codon:yes gene_type:complete
MSEEMLPLPLSTRSASKPVETGGALKQRVDMLQNRKNSSSSTASDETESGVGGDGDERRRGRDKDGQSCERVPVATGLRFPSTSFPLFEVNIF